MSHVNFIAGIPGAGKTALVIDLLMREVVPHNRPIFIDARINPLTLEHGPSIPEFGLTHQLIADARTWADPGVLPDGAVLVIDEAQDIWPVAPNGSKLPPELLAMNRLRHRGITLYLTSQRPAMIHSHIRGLVGRYILLRNLGFLGRRQYEWPEFPEHPLAFKSALTAKRYILPKAVFGLYKSSALHVKTAAGVPRVVLVLAVACLALGVMAWWAYSSIKRKTAPPALLPVAVNSQAPLIAGAPSQRSRTETGAPTVLRVSAPVLTREPYDGYGVHLAGSFHLGEVQRYMFTLSIAGRFVGSIRDLDLARAGYAFRSLGVCTGVLIFGDKERAVSCDSPSPPQLSASPLLVTPPPPTSTAATV